MHTAGFAGGALPAVESPLHISPKLHKIFAALLACFSAGLWTAILLYPSETIMAELPLIPAMLIELKTAKIQARGQGRLCKGI